MPKYRKKPVVIEAVQWSGDNMIEIDKFCGNKEEVLHKNGIVYIKTLEGTMEGKKGDFIIKGISGEFYPCKPDIFYKTYDKV